MKHILSNPYYEVLRFDREEEVCAGILDFAEQNKISAGWIWALGASEEVKLAFYNLKNKKYKEKTFKESLEILSITGNIGLKDGSPVIHIHGVFSRKNFSAIGGHIQKLVASGTVEVFIRKIDGTINRGIDENTGLNLMAD